MSSDILSTAGRGKDAGQKGRTTQGKAAVSSQKEEERLRMWIEKKKITIKAAGLPAVFIFTLIGNLKIHEKTHKLAVNRGK